MRHGNTLEAVRTGGRRKKLIAQAPTGIFEVPSVAPRLAGDIGTIGRKIKSQFLRQPRDEQFVLVGVGAAKLVVKMQNRKLDPQFYAQFR